GVVGHLRRVLREDEWRNPSGRGGRRGVYAEDAERWHGSGRASVTWVGGSPYIEVGRRWGEAPPWLGSLISATRVLGSREESSDGTSGHDTAGEAHLLTESGRK